LIGVVSTSVPDVPVTVSGYVPIATVEATVIDRLVPVADAAGVNTAVAPEGRPDTAKLTVPVKPFFGVTTIASEPLAACRMVTDADAGVSAKLGGLMVYTPVATALVV
jgi:hypothetical protein